MSQSTSTPKRVKPSKPYRQFPLTANGNGQWSKVIKGHTHYFGPWEDPDGALARYLKDKDDLHAGREPRPEGQTVKDLCNLYLEVQEDKLRSGEISQKHHRDTYWRCCFIVKHIGNHNADSIGPHDFTTFRKSFPDTWGVTSRAAIIKQVKTIFRFAVEERHLDRPPAYGTRFKPPTKTDKQKARAGKSRDGDVFTPSQIHRILRHCDETGQLQLKAMTLLAVNAGFGNADCGRLRDSDIENGWIRTYRGKTGEERDAPLWLETLEAINQWREVRTKQCGDLVFVTKYGQSWHKENGEKSPISQAFKRATRKLNITPSFYKLRHTFQTVCDQAGIARHVTRRVMGHAGQSISDDYSHGATDEQLRHAVSAVHEWLFSEGGAK
ncbi:MAG: tyrosine-type recombinase/integrase [Planctomycetota bacterium]